MKRELAGLRTVVTGASSGIGYAIAVAAAKAGMKVTATARRLEKINKLAEELRGHAVQTVQADITVAFDRLKILEETMARWGGLDILINVAGVGAWGHFETSTEIINRQILETNFFAPIELIRLCVPQLACGRQPAIVNLTSMTGRRGMPAWAEYSASKAALIGFSEAMRGEMARFGIDVLTIVPGLTRTGLSQNLLRSEGRVKIPYHQGMTTEYVAQQVLHALQRNTTELTLGREAKKILMLNRWMPRWLDRMIAKRVTQEYQRPAEKDS